MFVENSYFDRAWQKNKVACHYFRIYGGYICIDTKPPDKCPYILEQLMAEQIYAE